MTLIDRPVQLSDTTRQPPPRRPWRRWQITLITLAALFLGALLATIGLLWYYAQDLPELSQLQNYQPSLVTQVYSSDKQLIGQFFIERRILTPLAQIPEHLRRAVIAVEDVRFFEHPGLDYIGILRAAWTNLRRGGKVEGASTITQQLARSLFLSSERTFDRKVRELVLAYKMELVSSKEQILETYLNQIYFGQGAYGVASAAQSYFGKDLAALTVAEAAFLFAILMEPFDGPALVRQSELVVEGAVVQGPGEIPLGLAVVTRQGPLANQPAERAGGVTVGAVNTDAAGLALAPLLLRIEDGEFPLVDSQRNTVAAKQRVVSKLTICRGKKVV